MRNILTIILTFFSLFCFSQIDSIIKADFNTIGTLDLNVYKEKLNQFLRPKLISIDISEKFNKNLASNVYSIQYEIEETINEDPSFSSGTVIRHYINILTDNNRIAFSTYVNKTPKKIILKYDSTVMSEIKSTYKNTFNTLLDTSEIFEPGIPYWPFDSSGSNASAELNKLRLAVKAKNYQYLNRLLKSQFPAKRLYGILGVEIMKHKKMSIQKDLLAAYNTAKLTKGKVTDCDGDICEIGSEFQTVLKTLADTAKGL